MRRKRQKILDLDKIESIIAGALHAFGNVLMKIIPMLCPFIMDMK